MGVGDLILWRYDKDSTVTMVGIITGLVDDLAVEVYWNDKTKATVCIDELELLSKYFHNDIEPTFIAA